MIRPTCAAALVCIAATSAFADGHLPVFTADFALELENDFTFSSTDPDAEINDTFATLEGALSLAFSTGTSLNATVLFEPVLDAEDDRFFEDHGLFAQELFLAQEFEGGNVIFGKFNPAFGSAWDLAPGIFGVDFAEDYELTERLGAAITLGFDAFEGEHEFSLAAFSADTTFLSSSAVEDRGRLRGQDGGVSNTQSPASFAVSLAGAFGDTGYNAGVQFQSVAPGEGFNQYGFVGGVTHVIPFSDDNGVELLAEAAFFPDFDGAEEAAFIGTLGAAAPIGPVTLSGVYALRDIEDADTDHLATTTAEMELFDGFTGAVAYRFGREEGESNHTLGVLFVYEFGVSTE
ncbi:MAG: hypothetical protein AAFV19_22785 [Pseudomonadota bacterium]